MGDDRLQRLMDLDRQVGVPGTGKKSDKPPARPSIPPQAGLPEPRRGDRPSIAPGELDGKFPAKSGRPSIPPPDGDLVANGGRGSRHSIPPQAPAEPQAAEAAAPAREPITLLERVGRRIEEAVEPLNRTTDDHARRMGELERKLGSVARLRTEVDTVSGRLQAVERQLSEPESDLGKRLAVLGDGMDELDGRLKAAEAALGPDGAVGALTARVATIEEKPVQTVPSVADLSAEVKRLIEQALGPIRTQLDDVKKTLAGVSGLIDAAVAKAVVPLKEQLGANDRRLGELDAKLGETSGGLTRLTERVEGAEKKVDEKAKELEGALDAAKQQLGETVAAAQGAVVSSCEAAVTGVRTDVEKIVEDARKGVQAQVDSLGTRVGGVESQLQDPESDLGKRLAVLGDGMDEIDGRLNAAEARISKEGLMGRIVDRVDEVTEEQSRVVDRVAGLERSRDDHEERLNAMAEAAQKEKSGVFRTVDSKAADMEARYKELSEQVARLRGDVDVFAGPDGDHTKGWAMLYETTLTSLVATALLTDEYAARIKQLKSGGYGKIAVTEVLRNLQISETAEEQATSLGRPDDAKNLMERAKECLGG